MADQDLQVKKTAAAAGATHNSGVGIDGDGPSVADIEADEQSNSAAQPETATNDGAQPAPSDQPAEDPVTGTTSNATGAEQAAENENREPVS